MKVLHVNTEHGWRGGERQTLLTCRGLRDHGIRPGLVAQAGGSLEERAREAGIEVFPMKMRGGFDPFSGFSLMRIGRRWGADILHLQTSHAGSIGILSRSFGLRVPMVASRRVDFRTKSPWKYNRFDSVIAISEKIREILERAGVEKARIRVIPSGVPTEVESPANLEELRSQLADGASWVIGTVGHLTHHKGHRYLIEALPILLEEEPGLRLVVVGEGDLRENLEEQAIRLGVEKNVLFTGFRTDALDFLWAFDLFVLPSLLEGLCTSLLDAMVRRVPVVASSTGGVPEVVDSGRLGVLVPPRDPAALAEGVLRVIRDEERREALAADGLEWVKTNFSVTGMVEKTCELYREIRAGG